MSWLDNYSTTNTFRSMYINGFIDISGGRLQTRSVTDGHLFIAGDTSLNGNLYVGGDISWNPNNLADNSIPSSAIIGGISNSNSSTRKYIVMTANWDYTQGFSASLYSIASVFNTTSSSSIPEEGFHQMYTNINDVSHRLFRSWTTNKGPHSSSGVVPGDDTNYPYQNGSWDRYMGFRVKPGVWKCTITSAHYSLHYNWFLDKNKNRENQQWDPSTHVESEYRHDANYSGVQGTTHIAYIMVPAGSDGIIGLETNNSTARMNWSLPIIELEQFAEFESTDGDATAYVSYNNAFAPKWDQVVFNSNPRVIYT